MAQQTVNAVHDPEAERRRYDVMAVQVQRWAESVERAFAKAAAQFGNVVEQRDGDEMRRFCVMENGEIIELHEGAETRQEREHAAALARPLFAFDADEPARLRARFATWDFRNGT